MGILCIDLNNINLDNNFDEDDLDTIILVRLLAWHTKFKKHKALKKKISEELMSIPGMLKDGRIFACQNTRKKK